MAQLKQAADKLRTQIDGCVAIEPRRRGHGHRGPQGRARSAAPTTPTRRPRLRRASLATIDQIICARWQREPDRAHPRARDELRRERSTRRCSTSSSSSPRPRAVTTTTPTQPQADRLGQDDHRAGCHRCARDRGGRRPVPRRTPRRAAVQTLNDGKRIAL